MIPESDATKATRYSDAGVDIDAGNAVVDAIAALVRATRRPGADAEIGGFGGLFDLGALKYRDPLLVATTDGVGTKVKIAAETGIHTTIGIDLVAMCVNDLVVQGAEPLFFLDYFATGKLKPEVARDVVAGIAEGCRLAGAALIGGETAEMPGVYSLGDYDLAGFSVGAVERERLLPRTDLLPGDVVLGLGSSGVHSNGYSLVRRLVENARLGWNDAAPFAPDRKLGDALLTPTRIYVKPLLKALEVPGGIKALAHITGGGLTENIPRVLPETLAVRIDLPRIPPLAVFAWLARQSRVEAAELLRTFNCGIGMVVVVAEEAAGTVAATLRDAGETVVEIGRVEQRREGAVVYDGRLPY